MKKDICIVQTEKNGEFYYYRQGACHVGKFDNVIVETHRGVEFGKVMAFIDMKASGVKEPVRNIIRQASEADLEREADNEEIEKGAFERCKENIFQLDLEMKLVRVRCLFNRDKIIFYYTADNRVDFRALVRELASFFKTRIEMRQIGLRDEAKMTGGLGICGRTLCCLNMAKDFAHVSIKMAKDQGVPISQYGVTGACNRLKCCFSYENDTYEEMLKSLPRVGDVVICKETSDPVKVVSVNPLAEKIVVSVESQEGDSEVMELSAEDIIFEKKRHKCKKEGKREEIEKRDGNAVFGGNSDRKSRRYDVSGSKDSQRS